MKKIRPAMQSYIDEGKIAGISTRLIHQGEVIHSECYGMLDIEARKPIQSDSLDPAYTPGTGTPELGGLTTIQAQGLLRGLRGLNLIGADVVEVAPPFDPSGNTAWVGATVMYEILCLLVKAVAARSRS